MRKTCLLLVLLFAQLCLVVAQEEEMYEEITDTELSIPSAPAFAILGVTPELVQRPSDIKSFKVDWRIKNYNLAPDLALEAQPFWHFLFKKRSFEDYAQFTPAARKLSTLSFSFGTAKIDGINHASYAVKANLFSKNDPVTDQELIEAMIEERTTAEAQLDAEIRELVYQRRTATDEVEKETLQAELEALMAQKLNLGRELKETYRGVIDEYAYEHWNRSMLDAAFGMVYTYNNAGLDSLKLKYAGVSFWLNGCLQMGRFGLWTGIVKYSQIGSNANQLYGLSYRHGNPKYNFYVEMVFENLGNYFDPSLDEPFTEDEYFEDNFSEDLGSGWMDFNTDENTTQYTLSYGGDFRLSRNILLNFALRTKFTNEFKMDRLIPVANVVCLMK